jgi:hypothetical protein
LNWILFPVGPKQCGQKNGQYISIDQGCQIFLGTKFQKCTRGVVNFYGAGVVTHDRGIGSRSQSYDFLIYNYNASVVLG